MGLYKVKCNTLFHMKKVGEGSFSNVYKAKFSEEIEDGCFREGVVAVKILKGNNKAASLQEIERMRSFDSYNVIKLLAVIFPKDHGRKCGCDKMQLNKKVCWMLMEHVRGRTLIDWLQDSKTELNGLKMLTIALKVVSAMYYLHSAKINIVHGDLCARNVIIKRNEDIKLIDYGTYSGKVGAANQKPMNMICPIRWMPPENLPSSTNEPKYSIFGDVWSFGVLLFEIWSHGEIPFKSLSDKEVLKVIVEDKLNVLNYNTNVAIRYGVLKLMKQCFAHEISDRPTFTDIGYTIEELLDNDINFGS